MIYITGKVFRFEIIRNLKFEKLNAINYTYSFFGLIWERDKASLEPTTIGDRSVFNALRNIF